MLTCGVWWISYSTADAASMHTRPSFLLVVMRSGCSSSSTSALVAKPRSTTTSATGRLVLSASAAAAVDFLYPMCGSSAVTIPMEPCARSRHRSSLAVMPSMHLVRRVAMPRHSMSIDCKRLKMMSGSNTFSCSCPASDAMVMATSCPITWKHTWFTTSGITGLILPGMMDDPGAMGGRLISPNPQRGPEASRRRSLHVLDSLTLTRRSMPLKRRNAPVDDVASMKSSGDLRGRPVMADRCSMAHDANCSSAQMPVPMAVPPRLRV
mmetsp:Transcript_36472/g.89976  ORF Transcript_36472/g.89976 Transcript_36472/m.89976 type:complete len:266 (+) Transcript_36472:2262-3059(+)